MDYHVSFDIFFDGEDEPMTDAELKDAIKEELDSAGVLVYNFTGTGIKE